MWTIALYLWDEKEAADGGQDLPSLVYGAASKMRPEQLKTIHDVWTLIFLEKYSDPNVNNPFQTLDQSWNLGLEKVLKNVFKLFRNARNKYFGNLVSPQFDKPQIFAYLK